MIHVVDLFCGGGGTSTGAVMACADMRLDLDLLAINHWPIAVASHTANHPWARHICDGLERLRPRDLIPGGHLDLLVASPACTYHSRARGGKPCSDQQRSGAWQIIRWACELTIERILIENVPEFADWGPLDDAGKPIKARKGAYYLHFVRKLRRLGYAVDWRVLNAADYGDPTTRRRLFIQGRRGTSKITWPEPTHAGRWRPARDIIDWSLPSQSIFTRKKPLAKATLARIEAGIRKFCGERAEPFLVVLRQHQDASSLDKPVPTLTTSGANFALCQPFVVSYHGNHAGKTDSTTRVLDVADPIPTIDTQNRYGLVQPFVIGQQSGAAPRAVNEPLPTVATSGAIALVQPFLAKYNGTGGARPVMEPLPTLSTHDRFALVTPDPATCDIHFRMLQPSELAAAMSFPAGYQFTGNRADRVKQIGNAVPVQTAKALVKHLLS